MTYIVRHSGAHRCLVIVHADATRIVTATVNSNPPVHHVYMGTGESIGLAAIDLSAKLEEANLA